uniref:Insulin-like 3 isoform X2 n=1 Tax=Phascolarctos cinereus TaxID=38626 RepID=A0A6P5M976_PHACI|nr:insulin-like 3 isoform X2 [Phascolarctos cinereus]
MSHLLSLFLLVLLPARGCSREEPQKLCAHNFIRALVWVCGGPRWASPEGRQSTSGDLPSSHPSLRRNTSVAAKETLPWNGTRHQHRREPGRGTGVEAWPACRCRETGQSPSLEKSPQPSQTLL